MKITRKNLEKIINQEISKILIEQQELPAPRELNSTQCEAFVNKYFDVYAEGGEENLDPQIRADYNRCANVLNLDNDDEVKMYNTFASKGFSMQTLEKEDPVLAAAIKKLKNYNAKTYNLLFDGYKLHWRSGDKIIYSWKASSGHEGADETLLDHSEEALAQLANVLKILNSTDESKEQKLQNLKQTSGPLGFSKLDAALSDDINLPTDKLDDLLNKFDTRMKKAIDIYDKINVMVKKYKVLKKKRLQDDGTPKGQYDRPEVDKEMRSIVANYKKANARVKSLILPYIEFLARREGFSPEESNIEKKKAESYLSSQGPIPYGKYSIRCRLHDMSNSISMTVTDVLKMQAAWLDNKGLKAAVAALPSIDDASIGDGNNTAWGNFRVRITNPSVNTAKRLKMHPVLSAGWGEKRSGFFIHGGNFKGSSGCIDLGNGMDSFAKFWTLGGMEKLFGNNITNDVYTKSDSKRDVQKGEPLTFKDAGMQYSTWRIPLTVKYIERAKTDIIAKAPALKQSDKLASAIFGMA